MKKRVKEWTIKFPWGKVAMISWGNPANPAMLLVHGYMDTAATFIPLVEELPDIYYYVALDMPGLGMSDPFPPGVVVSTLSIVEVVRGIVEEMKWNSLVYLSHSMGFIVGMLYNHLYPGKITKMVHIDPGPPISMYYYTHHKLNFWNDYLYENYYSSYARWLAGTSKSMAYDEAVDMIVRNRSLTDEQAETVLSRSLVPVGDGKFKFSFETRMKKIASVPLSEETLYTIIAERPPPMLLLESSENTMVEPAKSFANNILEKCRLMLPNCTCVTVIGGHDVHITNPESIAPHILNFLKPMKHKKSKI